MPNRSNATLTAHRTCLALIVSIASSASAQQAASASVRDVYELHNRAAIAARNAGDWKTVHRHASALDTLFNSNPGTLMAVARASVRLGDTARALETVRTVIAMGVLRNLERDQDLAPLRDLPEWPAIAEANDRNARSAGTTRAVLTLPSADFLAEDIVWDGANHRYLVSSVRKGAILAVSPDGTSSPFLKEAPAGTWGIFGLAVDATRSLLWATTIAMPHLERYEAADSGRSAVLRFSLATGALEKRYELPATSRGNSPGDITVGPDGTLYVSDSRSGVIYALDPSLDSLVTLVPEGTFMSPQGPAVSSDGSRLYVADYIRGIAEIDLATRMVRWLRHDRSVALSGIDGLTVAGPGKLIALQNGLMPHRVVALTLDSDGSTVSSAAVLAQDTAVISEPTHGLIRGDEFLFIANSGWDGFDEKGGIRPSGRLRPPEVRAVRLRF